ncbi:MAG: hypothetical protein GVY14_04550, partial [Spirochaetes bacterium]|nr:hypothetical protein [Spirochaetota bacterium]
MPRRKAMSFIPQAMSVTLPRRSSRADHSPASHCEEPMISRGKTQLPRRSSGVASGAVMCRWSSGVSFDLSPKTARTTVFAKKLRLPIRRLPIGPSRMRD